MPQTPISRVPRGGWIYRGGMTILRPSTTTSLVMRLAWRIEAAGISYFALMPESVSPATTVWMVAAPYGVDGGGGGVIAALGSGALEGMGAAGAVLDAAGLIVL